MAAPSGIVHIPHPKGAGGDISYGISSKLLKVAYLGKCAWGLGGGEGVEQFNSCFVILITDTL